MGIQYAAQANCRLERRKNMRTHPDVSGRVSRGEGEVKEVAWIRASGTPRLQASELVNTSLSVDLKGRSESLRERESSLPRV